MRKYPVPHSRNHAISQKNGLRSQEQPTSPDVVGALSVTNSTSESRVLHYNESTAACCNYVGGSHVFGDDVRRALLRASSAELHRPAALHAAWRAARWRNSTLGVRRMAQLTSPTRGTATLLSLQQAPVARGKRAEDVRALRWAREGRHGGGHRSHPSCDRAILSMNRNTENPTKPLTTNRCARAEKEHTAENHTRDYVMKMVSNVGLAAAPASFRYPRLWRLLGSHLWSLAAFFFLFFSMNLESFPSSLSPSYLLRGDARTTIAHT